VSGDAEGGETIRWIVSSRKRREPKRAAGRGHICNILIAALRRFEPNQFEGPGSRGYYADARGPAPL
jgi:hypothetical protein